MDTNTAGIVALAIFGLVALGTIVFRSHVSIVFKSLLGSMKINASDDPPPTPPAIVAEEITSRKGGALMEDKTGRGVSAKKVDVETDVRISSEDSKDNPKD